MFHNRLEAGKMLAEKLKKYKSEEGVVLAVPRGGLPVAYAVAKELDFPVEIVLTKKIGHPVNKEYAIGAASLSDYFVIPHEDVSDLYIETEVKRIRKRLKKMYELYIGGKEPESVAGKTVIVIDDGIATGNTLLGTVHLLRNGNPGKIIIAAPVASPAAVRKLSRVADDVVVRITPKEFHGVGAFYKDFRQVSDDEVLFYLGKLKDIRKAS
ncbi:MAG: phosphoribosyltransferase [Bacteroidetes bacterium]|nr:MAG: phosphoribosyltransferase [Bacteroidota bacterium]